MMEIVRPHCRDRLSAADIEFVGRSLDPEGGGWEALGRLLCDADTRDRLLDEESLYHDLLESPACLQVSLEFYFYILTRRVLRNAGIDDREVADYIAALLAQFKRRRLRGGGGPGGGFYAVDLLDRISRSEGRRQFRLIARLGDMTLVLTGVFPEHVEHRTRRRGAPGLSYYEAVGSAQYSAASRHVLAHQLELDQIYAVLSNSFSTVRGALNDLSERLLFLEN